MEPRSRDRETRLVVLDGGPRAAAGAGKVWLVGAGPGDPELLTRKAERVLRQAEVVVHDRLVSEGVLALAAPGARRLYVGKRKSSHSVPQADLNELLVALARQGLQVVRLKGGDPFMFGRGGEELAACRAADVACEVVPGVSAALAAAAACGAPLTHRGLAQAVTFVTGHAAVDVDGVVGEPDLDWAALARSNQTVVVYMGLSTAPAIAGRLMAAGRPASTPVLIVENATRAEERRALCTLATLPQAAGTFSGPAVLVIGEVAALAQIEPLRSSPPGRGRSHPDWERSLPLEGGGAGVGVRAPRVTQKALAAPPAPFHDHRALTPIPGPSPFEGEGRPYAMALHPGGGEPAKLVEGASAAASRRPPQSAEFILGPAEGRTRGLTAPPEGEHLAASRRVRR